MFDFEMAVPGTRLPDHSQRPGQAEAEEIVAAGSGASNEPSAYCLLLLLLGPLQFLILKTTLHVTLNISHLHSGPSNMHQTRVSDQGWGDPRGNSATPSSASLADSKTCAGPNRSDARPSPLSAQHIHGMVGIRDVLALLKMEVMV